MSSSTPPDLPTLPGRIRWSSATAAFQIEGARTEGGRGRSVWDTWVDTPGKVKDGSTAEPGADSYHRWTEDVALAKGLRAAGNSVVEMHYAGLGHAGTLLALGAWGRNRGPVLRDTIAFLKAHL